MNGFGYVANRWIWAYALLAAYITAMELPRLKTLDAAHWMGVLFLVGTYIFIAYEAFSAEGREFFVPSVLLILICICGFSFYRLENIQYERLMIAITCITVFVPAFFSIP